MRTTLSMLGRQSVFRLQRSFDRMSDVRAELTSGKRIHSWSSDPLGLGMVRRYQGLLDRNEEYLRGAATARTFLEGTDDALQSMSQQLVRLRELVLQQSSEALANDETMAATRREVVQLRDAVLALANQEVEGEHIFAGYRTDQPPFRLEGDRVIYQGDEAAPKVAVSAGMLLETSLPGSELMGSDEARLAGTVDLRPRLEAGTPLDDLDRGRGFTGGTLRLTDGLAASVDVDLSGAVTVGDALAAINAATASAGVDLSVRISDDGSGLMVEGTGPLSVEEVAGSSAFELGILGRTDTNALTGRAVQALPSLNTALSGIASLDGRLPLGTLRFTLEEGVYDVDLSSATDLGDLRDLIRAQVPQMDLVLAGGTLQVVHQRSSSFVVESPGEDPTARALGLDGGASPARLFGVFQDVMDALAAGDEEALRRTLTEIDDVHGRLQTLDIDVGSRQNMVDEAERILQERAVSLKEQKGRVEDVDVIDAASRLSFSETAYEAALAVTARVFDLSLVRYL